MVKILVLRIKLIVNGFKVFGLLVFVFFGMVVYFEELVVKLSLIEVVRVVILILIYWLEFKLWRIEYWVKFVILINFMKVINGV